MAKPVPSQPLSELTVLEIATAVTGPYASMQLADMGAEVIKVEKPGRGDDTRSWSSTEGAESAYFLAFNRGKKSIAIDLKTKRGQEIVRELALQSDIVIENMTYDALEHTGIDLAAWRAKNSRLITCSIKGFPKGTPREKQVAYDVIIQALTGIMDLTGNEEPMKVPFAITDIITAEKAVSGILAALYARERDGVGTHIDVDLYTSMISAMPSILQEYLISGVAPQRLGNAHRDIVPYESFNAQDRPFVLGVGNDKHWGLLSKALGRPEWITDPRYATNPARVAHRTEIVTALSDIFRTKPCRVWVKLFESHGIPAAVIKTVPEVLADESLRKLHFLIKVHHPTMGDIPLINMPIRFGGSVPDTHLPPPLLGEHTNDILATLGYRADDIAALRQNGVVA